MKYPWDLESDDPLNYGMLQAAGALLTPERQGGGMGPAFSRFGTAVSHERQNQIDAILKKDLIDSRRKNVKTGEGLPANVRTALWYTHASPEEKKAFEFSVRNNTVRGPNGEVYAKEVDGTLRRLTDIEQTIVERGALAGATAHGKGAAESQYEVKEGVDAQGKPVFKTTAQLLQELGQTPRNQFSGMRGYNPAMAAAGPPASQQAPQDYPATAAGLNQARTDLSAQFPNNVMPPAMGATRPAAAGTEQRKHEAAVGTGTGEAVVAAQNLQNKLPDPELMRSLGNELKNHPGKKFAIGYGGIVPDALRFPNSSHSNYMARWDEIQGKQFAQAFESLKGGGSITVVESTRAAAALSRLKNRDQTHEEYDKAVDEFVDNYEKGMRKIEARAKGIQPITEKKAGAWADDKEARYQEWKRSQGQ